jgi:tetratricopeptide (TPR) repeat protein
MILTAISFLIVVACLAGIIKIIARRWHALTSIDLENLPAERDAKTKKKILSERLKRRFYEIKTRTAERSAPVFSRIGTTIQDFSSHIHGMVEAALRHKQIQKEEERGVPVTESTALSRLLRDAAAYLEKQEYDEAEKRYIDAVALDPKNLEAYAGLATIYKAQKEWAGAQEVLEYLRSHLREHAQKGDSDAAERSAYEMRLAESLIQLSDVYRVQDTFDEARSAMEQALEIQPQNPKFLDAALELYIMIGTQKEARAMLKRLKEANPENQKIADFEDRIRAL